MKYIKVYKIFESNIVLDTVNDIILDINDLDAWNAKAWEKDNGDIIVIIEMDSFYSPGSGMVIPDEVFSTIKRLIDYLGSYDPIIFIGDKDPGPPLSFSGRDPHFTSPELYELDFIDNGLVPQEYGGSGFSLFTKGKELDISRPVIDLWANEFIRIDFRK